MASPKNRKGTTTVNEQASRRQTLGVPANAPSSPSSPSRRRQTWQNSGDVDEKLRHYDQRNTAQRMQEASKIGTLFSHTKRDVMAAKSQGSRTTFRMVSKAFAGNVSKLGKRFLDGFGKAVIDGPLEAEENEKVECEQEEEHAPSQKNDRVCLMEQIEEVLFSDEPGADILNDLLSIVKPLDRDMHEGYRKPRRDSSCHTKDDLQGGLGHGAASQDEGFVDLVSDLSKTLSKVEEAKKALTWQLKELEQLLDCDIETHEELRVGLGLQSQPEADGKMGGEKEQRRRSVEMETRRKNSEREQRRRSSAHMHEGDGGSDAMHLEPSASWSRPVSSPHRLSVSIGDSVASALGVEASPRRLSTQQPDDSTRRPSTLNNDPRPSVSIATFGFDTMASMLSPRRTLLPTDEHLGPHNARIVATAQKARRSMSKLKEAESNLQRILLLVSEDTAGHDNNDKCQTKAQQPSSAAKAALLKRLRRCTAADAMQRRFSEVIDELPEELQLVAGVDDFADIEDEGEEDDGEASWPGEEMASELEGGTAGIGAPASLGPQTTRGSVSNAARSSSRQLSPIGEERVVSKEQTIASDGVEGSNVTVKDMPGVLLPHARSSVLTGTRCSIHKPIAGTDESGNKRASLRHLFEEIADTPPEPRKSGVKTNDTSSKDGNGIGLGSIFGPRPSTMSFPGVFSGKKPNVGVHDDALVLQSGQSLKPMAGVVPKHTQPTSARKNKQTVNSSAADGGLLIGGSMPGEPSNQQPPEQPLEQAQEEPRSDGQGQNALSRARKKIRFALPSQWRKAADECLPVAAEDAASNDDSVQGNRLDSPSVADRKNEASKQAASAEIGKEENPIMRRRATGAEPQLKSLKLAMQHALPFSEIAIPVPFIIGKEDDQDTSQPSSRQRTPSPPPLEASDWTELPCLSRTGEQERSRLTGRRAFVESSLIEAFMLQDFKTRQKSNVQSSLPAAPLILSSTPLTQSQSPSLATSQRASERSLPKVDAGDSTAAKLQAQSAKPVRVDVLADELCKSDVLSGSSLQRICRREGSTQRGATGGLRKVHTARSACAQRVQSSDQGQRYALRSTSSASSIRSSKAGSCRGSVELHVWGWELDDLYGHNRASCMVPAVPGVSSANWETENWLQKMVPGAEDWLREEMPAMGDIIDSDSNRMLLEATPPLLDDFDALLDDLDGDINEHDMCSSGEPRIRKKSSRARTREHEKQMGDAGEGAQLDEMRSDEHLHEARGGEHLDETRLAETVSSSAPCEPEKQIDDTGEGAQLGDTRRDEALHEACNGEHLDETRLHEQLDERRSGEDLDETGSDAHLDETLARLGELLDETRSDEGRHASAVSESVSGGSPRWGSGLDLDEAGSQNWDEENIVSAAFRSACPGTSSGTRSENIVGATASPVSSLPRGMNAQASTCFGASGWETYEHLQSAAPNN